MKRSLVPLKSGSRLWRYRVARLTQLLGTVRREHTLIRPVGSTPIPRTDLSERTVAQPKKSETSFLSTGVNRMLGFTNKQLYNRKNVGYVNKVVNQTVFIDGVTYAKPHSIITFENGQKGYVVRVSEKGCTCNILDTHVGPPSLGEKVALDISLTGKTEKFRTVVGPGLLGRVVDANGNPIDGNGEVKGITFTHTVETSGQRAPPWRSHVLPKNISRIQTGVKVLDAFFPLGKGRRFGITGPRTLGGKSELAIDLILSYHQENEKLEVKDQMNCVYVLTGKRREENERIIDILRDSGALEYTTVVVADETESNTKQYLSPFTGMTIADFYKWRKANCTIVFDDLSAHNRAAVECFNNSRGLINYGNWGARLLERSGQLRKAYGGGSLTTFAICDTDDDREETLFFFLPHFHSHCDTYIELDSNLHEKGIVPPISIFPVPFSSPAFQKGPLRYYSAKLRETIYEGMEVQRAARESDELNLDLDWDVEETINNLGKIERLFSQSSANTTEETVLLLFIAIEKELLSDIHLTQMPKFENAFFDFLDSDTESSSVDEAIRRLKDECSKEANGPLSPETEELLRASLRDFLKSRPEFKESDALMVPDIPSYSF